ncbi:MAG TPA: DUF1028 domain-containing protein [Bacteroidia bacterium]|nr:DUF1028 domain-containing protein [Bacteroidia bacterium]
MKKLLTAACLFYSFISSAQDTFSICAVDTVTGEAGSAGASCIDATQIAGGVVIISDVHPGVGVIHSQALWLAANQNYAKGLMNIGLSPQQIIDSLIAHDVQNNPAVRQYGITDLYNGGARVAAYTGINCMNYKNHITGPNYSIQGNILLGQQILDSMEARFLNTPGDLACKLMAALQGAKVPGADTRCLLSGNSSKSSFLRIACPGDVAPNYTLNLIVPQGPVGFEPIDSLQVLFDNVHNCSLPVNCSTGISTAGDTKDFSVTVVPNPFKESTTIRVNSRVKDTFSLQVFSNAGLPVLKEEVSQKTEWIIDKGTLSPGIYFYHVVSGKGKIVSGKLVMM